LPEAKKVIHPERYITRGRDHGFGNRDQFSRVGLSTVEPQRTTNREARKARAQ
jgi:hypothetical protein